MATDALDIETYIVARMKATLTSPYDTHPTTVLQHVIELLSERRGLHAERQAQLYREQQADETPSGDAAPVPASHRHT